MQTGVLVLVVGPSGAGKDTLMDAARAGLAADPRYRFARRLITRPAMAGAEDHDSCDEAGFRADANLVLRQVYERMQRENHDFYPRIEAMEVAAAA